MSSSFALAPTRCTRFQSGAFASPPASSLLAVRNSSKAPASCQLGQAKAAFAGNRNNASAFIGRSCGLSSSVLPRTGNAGALPFFSTTTCQTSSSDVLSQSETLGPGFGSFGIDWENGARQVMEGFGGGITWYGSWAVAHPNRDAIFDTVFSELKPSVLRIRNTFGQGTDDGGLGGQTTAELMEETAFVVNEGRKRLTGVDEFKILMCSWSPPAALKKSGTLNGGEGGSFGADTLRKDSRGVFIYEEFAQYWLESLKAFAAMGVEPMWISINNEPDWGGTGRNLGGGHPVCIFRPSEDYFYPGYYRAFDEIYDTLKAGLETPPLMCGPETAGFDNFETAPLNGLPEGFQIHPYSGHPRVHAICNHFYDAGVTYSHPNFFRNLDVSLRNARRHAVETQTKRMFMTEHANLAPEKPSDPLDLARTIYQALTVAELNMYLQWDLLWGRSNEGTMVIVDNPFAGGFDASQRDEFETTQSFYWYKHFCRYVRAGMQRLATTDETGLEGIWPLVFLSKVNSESTVILINSTDVWTRVECNYLPNEVEGFPRKVYYSTLAPEEKFEYAGLFPNESKKIWLKPSSITTIHSGEH